MKIQLFFVLVLVSGCAEQKVSEDEKKIDASIAKQLSGSPEYSKNMYQQCMKMPSLGWDMSAERKCGCVRDNVLPNLKAVFQEVKARSNGSFDKFQSFNWDELLSEKVTKKSFSDCGFQY